MNRFLRVLVLAIFLPLPVRAQDKQPLAPPEAKKAFLRLLDRPKIPADVKVDSNPIEKNGLIYNRWSFASEKKADGNIERVPVLTVKPTGSAGSLPAIILLHGTGGSKEGMMSWVEEFAKQGVEAIAIDARYHGERSGGKKGSAAYVAAIEKAWKTPAGSPQEHPFYYDTVWDLWRLVDLLEDKAAKEPRRIGMLGISMGGIETWLAASVDDRVAVAAPLIGVQSFRWSLEHDKWQGRANTIKAAHEAAARDLGEPMVNRKVCRELWNKVIPDMLDDFDCPNLIGLFADRALFIANGDLDGNCPIDGARLAFNAAEKAFAKTGDKGKLEILVGEKVGHTVTAEHHKAAVAFCVKWLKAR
ncbi:MAG TPA: alpha/beta fold hydrolase [Urbifossiella sp.]|jgi:dienelactone hydrolase